MRYQTYLPHPDLQSVIKCFWTLEVPADPPPEKQRVVPDGYIALSSLLYKKE